VLGACGGGSSQSNLAAQREVPASLGSLNIFAIAEENRSYESVVGNPRMPYLNSLLRQGATAAQYYSNTPGSLDSWMWLMAGQFVTDQAREAGACFNVDNIARSLLTAGMTWKSYNEGLPTPGDPRLYIGAYMRAHNPLSNFSDTCAPSQRINSVPFSYFANDVRGDMANFVYLDPNTRNDLHSGSYEEGDAWLQRVVPQVLARPEFRAGKGGQLWIVFDEGDLRGAHGALQTDHRCDANTPSRCGGHVLAAVIGPQVKAGTQSQTVYHQENVLSTWTAALGIAPPNGAASAPTMSDLFR
jgi:hypothetical protein